MRDLSAKQVAARERTLLIALLLSMWAPLATGYAVLMSHSTTQLADFIRRRKCHLCVDHAHTSLY